MGNNKNGDHPQGKGKCPFMGGEMKETAGGGAANRDWWPNQLKLNILRQNSELTNPPFMSPNSK